MWIAASKLGPLIVPSVCIIVIQLWGWREIFYVFAVPGILFAIAWMFLVTNSPSENRFCSPAEQRYILDESNDSGRPKARRAQLEPMPWLDTINRTKKVPELAAVGHVFRSWNIFGVALGYGCMIGISNIFISWIPTYLVTVKGFASVKMGFLASAPFIGAVTGNMLGGWISDRFLGGRRKPMMMLGALGTMIMMIALIDAPNSVLYLGAALIMTGLMLDIGLAGYSAYPMGLATKATYPTAFSIVNSVGQMGGACAPLAVGFLLDSYSWTSVFVYMLGTSLLCLLLLISIVEPIAQTVKK